MAAKKRRTQHRGARHVAKRYAGKTEKEWRDWGAEFGKGIDRGSKNFSEGMERLGEDFGKHMEKHGKRMCCRNWSETFGLMGPLIRSLVGIILLLIVIWILNFVSYSASSSFVFMLSNFLSINIPWFFLASFFFGYCDYLSLRNRRSYWLVSPIVNSLKVVFVLWILASILNLSGIYTGTSIIIEFSNFVLVSLPALFSVLVILGYAFEIIIKMFKMWYKK
jgi:hypothetical protein